MIDESEGRIPHRNQAVRDALAKSGGIIDCSRHRHWISTSGTIVCAVCHPRRNQNSS